MQQRLLLCILAAVPACYGQIRDPEANGAPPAVPGMPGTSNPPGSPPVIGPNGLPLTPGQAKPPLPPETGPVESFACTTEPQITGAPLRRLTSLQYRNTLQDLIGYALNDMQAGRAVLGVKEVAQALSEVPVDERKQIPQDLHGSYRRLDQDLDQGHVDGFFGTAKAIGAALTQPGRLGALLTACGTDADPGNDSACVDSFIQRFGALALRRPLTPEDVAFYRGYYGNAAGIDPAGIADVIAGMLLAPEFLYVTEHGTDAVAGQATRVKLSGFELATRLSYHFWQTMPDPQLLEAARSHTLETDAGYRGAVDRLFADPRTRATLDQFFAESFKLEDLPALGANVDDPAYRNFAGADLPGPDLRQAVADEVVDIMRQFTWAQPTGYDDVLQTDLVLTKNPALARIYGKRPWVEGTTPDRFAPGERPGLITRAAFLVNGTSNTRPVMKGVFLRHTLLCDDIPPPPANANAVPPPLDGKRSTRQIVEALTEQPGTACAACHTNLINPLGFATENFDALGRVRTEQRLFDASGKEIGKVPVDTRSVPQIIVGDTSPSMGAADVARLLVASGKPQACMARQYFRFTFGRWEDLKVDGCTLEALRKSLVAGGTMQGMFKEIALTPQFRERVFP